MRELRFHGLSLYFPYRELGDDWFIHYRLFTDLISRNHRWRFCPP